MSPGTAIAIERVTRRFGEIEALVAISARIDAGTLSGLVGPDGAGKTTLLRMMAGLLTPDDGVIRARGIDVSEDADAAHRIIGYMPQRFGLYEDLSVIENLRLYADLKSLSAAARNETFDRLLHFTRLAPFVKRRAGQLSGGMKQKLGLACALMGEPDILLLDEPSVGVDPISRRELWSMVQELAGDGMAVIWSTAYLDEAERCERVLLLDEGRLLHDGAPEDLTRELAGRCFRIRGLGSGRRELLSRLLDTPNVRDGVIQGSSVRLVTDENGLDEQARGIAAEAGAVAEPATPRFEDAFVDRLGGSGGGRSQLAARLGPIESERDVMVECRQLTRRFGDFTAAKDVTFSVRRGEVFGLLGPNGAGKSTTFRMLCGLLEPSSGSAEVVGLDLRRAAVQAKRQLGYMAQKFSLYGLLSVRQNLDFFAGAYGLDARTGKRRSDEMIATFGLEQFLDVSPDTLPLGYKQRLALACALMHRPIVLFLDEPTSGVDPLTRREFWRHITGLVGNGVTVLVTTHFMDEAEYCDRVALIHRSEVIALDSTDRLKDSVADEQLTDPTMEDAFIRLVERHDADDRQARAA